MTDPADLLRQLDALVQLGLRLAGSATSGRAALAKLADTLDPVWIPEPWDRTVWPALDRARASAREPVPFRAVEDVLRSAWGGRPSAELDALEPEPAAVTPTSQVHRGVREGRPVAVKVLRPGIAGAVRQDLALLDALALPLAALLPGIDTGALLREARERILDEFDLEHEAANQRRFARALRNHPHLIVPAPVTDLCREQVLVSEWIDGRPLSAAPVADADAVAAHLVGFVVGGLREGLVHADLGLDDVLIVSDGRIAVLDFGAVAHPQRDRVGHTAAAVTAFRARDAEALGRALHTLGILTDRTLAPEALALARHALGPLGAETPARLDTEAVLAARDRAGERPQPAVRLLMAASLDPLDLWPGRGIAQAFATIARVGATASWPELISRALADGWS